MTPSRSGSMLRYCPYLVLLAIVLADSARVADPDLWGHIRFGQAIIRAGHPPYRDIYSFTAAGRLWRDPEWFSQVLMALSYNMLGIFGLKLFKFACAAATVILLAAAEAETGASLRVQSAVLIMVAAVLVPFFQFRPQVVTFALFSGLMLLLARHNLRGRSPLWLAVPLFVLWVNLHGGYVVGLAALAAYSGTLLAGDMVLGMGPRRAAYPCLVTIMAAAATLANPYGLESWVTVARSIGNPISHHVVIEWEPLIKWFAGQFHASVFSAVIYSLLWGLPVLALAACVVLEPRCAAAPLLAVAALFVASAFVSVRNVPLAMIPLSVALARSAGILSGASPALSMRRAAQSWREVMARLTGSIGGLKEAQPAIGESGNDGLAHPQSHQEASEHVVTEPIADNLRTGAAKDRVAILIIYALALILAVRTGLFSNRLKLLDPCPVGALAFMRLHGLSGNVLADYSWSAYVIWHGAPADKVFADHRFETFYPTDVLREYVNFVSAAPGATRALEAYPTDFVLTSPQGRTYNLMLHAEGWKLIYHVKSAALFAHSTLKIRASRPPAHPGPEVSYWFP